MLIIKDILSLLSFKIKKLITFINLYIKFLEKNQQFIFKSLDFYFYCFSILVDKNLFLFNIKVKDDRLRTMARSH